jgi:hypothetical protein
LQQTEERERTRVQLFTTAIHYPEILPRLPARKRSPGILSIRLASCIKCPVKIVYERDKSPSRLLPWTRLFEWCTTLPDTLEHRVGQTHFSGVVCPASNDRHAEVLRQLSREVTRWATVLNAKGSLATHPMRSNMRWMMRRVQAHL